ncbi:unnamed protein product [Penicillium bialowiezense]
MALTVAVAGATGAVGRTIVEQILNENKFSVVALTRREHVESPVSGVQYIQTDYDDHATLVQQLERHAVQTVICAIGMLGDDCSEAQISLIKAADEASTVQRFITSEFGYFTHEEYCLPRPRPGYTGDSFVTEADTSAGDGILIQGSTGSWKLPTFSRTAN